MTGRDARTAALLRQIVAELAEEFLERHDTGRMLMVSLLAQSHPFLLGPPGTGKSALVRALCNRIVNARYAEFLCDRSMPLEVLFGQIDIKAFTDTGDWKRRMEGYLPTAHVAFADEIGKAGPVALNPLLGAMNERQVRNGDQMVHIPLLMMAGASNELLEPELAALWDRFLVRMSVDYLVEESSFASLMASAVQLPGAGPVAPTTVPLDELEHAVRSSVPSLAVPGHVIGDLAALRRTLKAEGVVASDRRWKQSVRLLQASAFLDGRAEVAREDLPVLVHTLWTVEPEIPVVQDAVLGYEPPDAKELRRLETRVAEIAGEIGSRRGQPRRERAKYGGQARADLEEVRRDAGAVEGDERRRDALVVRCNEYLQEVLVDVLNFSQAQASAIIAGQR